MNNYIALEGQLAAPFANSEAIAERVAACLLCIASLNPLFNKWMPNDSRRHRSPLPDTLTWPPEQTELRVLVNEGTRFKSRKGRKARIGYHVILWTPENDPIQVNFWLTIDFTDGAWWFLNRVGITFFVPDGNIWVELQRNGQNPITFAQYALLDLATTWDCDWAGVRKGDYSEQAPNPPLVPPRRYNSGWMIYLDAARAARVGKADDVKVERLANGGALFTTVPDTIFDGRKADHMAAARRLQTALVPLNEPASDGNK